MLKKTLMISGIATVVTLLAACAGGNDDSAANSAAGADDSDGFAQVKAAGQEPETKPGGDNRASGDARTHMCKLISADEVSAIIGEPMRNGKESLQASGKLSISDCLWLADGESSAGVLQR